MTSNTSLGFRVSAAKRSRSLSGLQAFLRSEGILVSQQDIARALRITQRRVYRPWATQAHGGRSPSQACVLVSQACARTFLRVLGMRTYRRQGALGLYLFELLSGP